MKFRAVSLLFAVLCMALGPPTCALSAVSDAAAKRDHFIGLCEQGDAEAVRRILQDDGVNLSTEVKATGLISAIAFGHTGVIETMLGAEVDVNAKGYVGDRALMAAARRGNAGMVKLLLSAGADVNAGDDNGKTALMEAAGSGSPEVVRILLAAGADVNAQTVSGMCSGLSALMCAAGTPETAEILLSAGADVEARLCDGRTALMLAAEPGWHESVKVLLAAGADVQARDEEGHDALWHVRNPRARGASKADPAKVIRLLQSGGKRNAVQHPPTGEDTP